MKLDLQRARVALQAFDFRKLFIEELGWANYTGKPFEIRTDDHVCKLVPIAEQGGMVIYEGQPVDNDSLAPSHVRKTVDREVAKRTFEHLIIFTDAARKRSVWLWTKRESGKTAAFREHTFHASQPGDSLLQKLDGLFFDLDELDAQGRVPIITVVQRVAKQFDVETVTKKFYQGFETEHDRFLKFLQGIQDQGHRGWYASVMLNRLMFIYFIQKKGFLDGDTDYLSHRLAASQARGKDKFYRQFLTRLFFDGFATEEKDRSADTNKLLGKIPYLNGGIFLPHEIEKQNPDLDIPDAAFERLFAFFNRYRWHLDDRPHRADNEINPDVLGYIFEKYINQKQMGAYYTKEDITDYICKNTIIPFLFDKLATFHPKAVNPLPFSNVEAASRRFHDSESKNRDGSSTLAIDPYIYPAVKHGCDKPLPPEIAAGLNPPGLHDPVPEAASIHDIPTIRLRQAWDKPAPPEYALPTEIWREVIARRRRYHDICQRLGGPRSVVAEYPADAMDSADSPQAPHPPPIQDINDFITLNLDIVAYAQDFIRNLTDPLVLRAFYFECLQKLSVLDPTCGSGAFLFAALNILEPLYELCLDKMEEMVGQAFPPVHAGKVARASSLRIKYKDFVEELQRVERHPNRRHFIYKNIIVNNLYGVDIMAEAVEICKLRLFLKLVAETDDPDRVEPLPDIDFNIRAGNTLVGYATLAEVQQSLFGRAVLDRIRQVDIQLRAYRNCQTEIGIAATALRKNKEHIRTLLAEIEDKLDCSLFSEYGARDLTDWKRTHQPFHWYVEFNSIIQAGGFDVIVGNPPYVEYSQVRKEYTLRGYSTLDCGNLYAYVIERCYDAMTTAGRMGMIVQLPIVCTDRMKSLQRECMEQSAAIWFANFDDRPARLFDGLEHIRATIFTCRKDKAKTRQIYATAYNRWYSEVRSELFALLAFEEVSEHLMPGAIPKIGQPVAKHLRQRIGKFAPLARHLTRHSRFPVYFHNAPQYWIRAMDFAPYFWNERDGEQLSTQVKLLDLPAKLDSAVVTAALNSSLFYWWFIILSDCRHLNLREIETFPIGLTEMRNPVKQQLAKITDKLMTDLKKHKERKECQYKATGRVAYDEFYPKFSKPIIDEIDCVLAGHYGLTAEELDFVVNYDIKYRLGRAAGEGDSE